MRSRLTFILRLLIGGGIVFVLFKKVPYRELAYHIKNLNLFFLLLSFALFFSLQFLVAFRWMIILRGLSLKVRYKDAFFTFFCGLFFNLIFPSFIAGDFFRGGALGIKDNYSYKKLIASILLDRFGGLLGLGALSVLSFLAGRDLLTDKNIYYAVSFIFLVIFFLSLFIFSKIFFNLSIFFTAKFPKLRRKLEEFHDCLYLFRKNPLLFLKVFLLSFFIQTLVVVSFYFIALSFHIPSYYIIYFFILVPLIICAIFLPVTVGGLGTREVAMIFFFSKIGIDKSVSLGISLISFVALVVLGILGGLVYVAFYSRWIQSDKKKQSA